MAKPRIVIFDHIAKTGGTSVWHAFRQAGCPVLRFHEPGARLYNPGGSGPLLLCGHRLFHKHQRPKSPGLLYFTILRHPVECFYSEQYGRMAAWVDGDDIRGPARQMIDHELGRGLPGTVQKCHIDPGRYHFVGVLEEWNKTIGALSELAGVALNASLHLQRSGRGDFAYRRDEIAMALAPEIAIWKRVRGQFA